MDRKTAIDKIKKCLRLARSCEPAEAAAALRQARKLMAEFGFNDEAAFEAGEADAKSGAAVTPPLWETRLAGVVGGAFACRHIFSSSRLGGKWRFIGTSGAEQIAAYSFAVLYRQCKAARKAHADKHLKRCGPKNKVIRSDEFCMGWVFAASELVPQQERTVAQTTAIQAYVAQHYPNLGKLDPIHRESKRPTDDAWHGVQAGQQAQLNKGVGGSGEQKRLA